MKLPKHARIVLCAMGALLGVVTLLAAKALDQVTWTTIVFSAVTSISVLIVAITSHVLYLNERERRCTAEQRLLALSTRIGAELERGTAVMPRAVNLLEGKLPS